MHVIGIEAFRKIRVVFALGFAASVPTEALAAALLHVFWNPLFGSAS